MFIVGKRLINFYNLSPLLWKMLLGQVSTNTRPQLYTLKPGAAVSYFLCRQKMQRGNNAEIAVEMVPTKRLSITMYTQN